MTNTWDLTPELDPAARRRLQRIERRMEALLAMRFRRQAKASLPGLLKLARARARKPENEHVAAADPDPALEAEIHATFKGGFTAQEMRIWQDHVEEAYTQGRQASAVSIGLASGNERFTLVNRESRRMLQEHTRLIIDSVDTTTRSRLGWALSQGLEEGEHLDGLQRRVEGVLGEGGYRARMTAQTETINSYALGTEETARELGVTHMRWENGQERACPICVALHGAIKELNGTYSQGGYERRRPPAHPNCRCAQDPYFEDPESDNPLKPSKEAIEEAEDLTEAQRVALRRMILDPKNKTREEAIEQFLQFYPNSSRASIARAVGDSPAPAPRAADLKKRFGARQEELLRLREESHQRLDDLSKALRGEEEDFGDDDSPVALARRAAINKRIDATLTQHRAINKNLARLSDEVKDAVRSDFPSLAQIDVDPNLEVPQILEGVDSFRSLVGSGILDEGYVPIRWHAEKNVRAHYRPNFGDIWMGANARAKAVVHELGHWLEDQSIRIQDLRRDFIQRRLRPGEEPQKLRDLLNNDFYRDDEIAYRDEFSNPYIGKVYEYSGGSEVISMGLQYIEEDSIGFLLSDPDHFDFMMDVLDEVRVAIP